MATPEEERFARLYEQRDQLRGALLRRGADPWTAEEVTHEAFVVAWRRLADVPEGAAGHRWLHGVARRLLANARRAARRRLALASRLAGDPGSRPGEADPLAELRPALADAWRTLTDAERHVLLQALHHGVGRDTLARSLGCSPSAAAMRLSRARARLHSAVERIAS